MDARLEAGTSGGGVLRVSGLVVAAGVARVMGGGREIGVLAKGRGGGVLTVRGVVRTPIEAAAELDCRAEVAGAAAVRPAGTE